VRVSDTLAQRLGVKDQDSDPGLTFARDLAARFGLDESGFEKLVAEAADAADAMPDRADTGDAAPDGDLSLDDLSAQQAEAMAKGDMAALAKIHDAMSAAAPAEPANRSTWGALPSETAEGTDE